MHKPGLSRLTFLAICAALIAPLAFAVASPASGTQRTEAVAAKKKCKKKHGKRKCKKQHGKGSGSGSAGTGPAKLSIKSEAKFPGTLYTPGVTEDATVVLQNVGGEPTGTVGAGATGYDPTPSGAFRIQSNNCAEKTLAPGATCSVVIRWTPAAPGVETGTFTADEGLSGDDQVVQQLSATSSL